MFLTLFITERSHTPTIDDDKQTAEIIKSNLSGMFCSNIMDYFNYCLFYLKCNDFI